MRGAIPAEAAGSIAAAEAFVDHLVVGVRDLSVEAAATAIAALTVDELRIVLLAAAIKIERDLP